MWPTLVGLFSVPGDPFLGTWSTWPRWSSTCRYVSASASRPRANGSRWGLRQQCTVAVAVTVASRLSSLLRRPCSEQSAAIPAPPPSSQQSLPPCSRHLLLFNSPQPRCDAHLLVFYPRKFYENFENVLGNFWRRESD